MKKYITIIIVIISLLNQVTIVQAQTASSVAGLAGGSSVWQTSRNLMMPTLMRMGTVARWGAGSFTPAGVAAIVGGVLYQVYKEDPQSFAQLAYWLNSMGIGVQSGTYTMSKELLQPTPGSEFESCLAYLESLPAYGTPTIKVQVLSNNDEYMDIGKAMGFFGTKQVCNGTLNYNLNQSCNGFGLPGIVLAGRATKNVYNYNTSTGYCNYAGELGVNLVYVAGTLLPSQYTNITFTSSVHLTNIMERMQDALTSGTGTALNNARNAAMEVMKWLNNKLVNDPASLSQKQGSSNKSLFDIVNEQARAAVGTTFLNELETDANVSQGADVSDNLQDKAKNEDIAKEETGEETEEEGDPGETPEMPELPVPPEDENDSVIGTLGGQDDIDEQKSRYGSILAPLKAIYNSLNNSIMGAISNIIPSGGSSLCSFGISVFGGSGTVDFCSIDYSAIRSLIIAVGGLVALMILFK